MPAIFKKISCDFMAVFFYMPFILTARFFNLLGLKKLAKRIPLSDYANKSFFIIRNDTLDRFGTRLEQRFSKQEITSMMTKAGLTNITFGADSPFWHAVGQRL
jgi:hypothetical protein